MDSIIKTLQYETYTIKEKNGYLVCHCEHLLGNINISKSKKDIFLSIISLGQKLFNQLNLLDDFYINKRLDNAIRNKTDFEEYYYDYDDDIKEYNFFMGLKKILKNKDIKKIIVDWFKENGIPNFRYEDKNLYLEEKTETIKISDCKSFSAFNLDPNFLKKSSINVFYPQNAIYFKRFFSYLKRYDFNIIPYINIALLTFLIYDIKSKLSSVRTKYLKDVIQPFQYLKEEYKKADFVYSSKIGLTINNYLKNLIYYFQIYIRLTIHITNKEEITFPDNIKFPEFKSDIPWIDFNFFTTQYISLNPFLTAFEYLLQTLSKNQIIESVSFCEECGNRLTNNQHLCFNCKEKLYIQIKQKYQRLNKLEKLKLIENEYELLKANPDTHTPIIEKIYYDRIYQSKRYKKISNQ